MRCIFARGRQKELLLFVKMSLGLSWREFAGKLDIGYTTLREWRDEKWSMRYSVFQKLIEICPASKTFQNYITKMNDDDWGRKLGGLSTKQRQHGFLDPKYDKLSSKWKSFGGQIGTRKWHDRMKKESPQEYRQIQYDRIKQSVKYKHEYQGHKYRNFLELEVAKTLADKGVDFEYEKLLRCEDRFYFPDFVFEDIIIECTFWDNVEQKAIELRQKVADYQKLIFRMAIIITTRKYLEEYSKFLDASNVRVITSDGLSELLDGKLGRVKRA